MPALIPAAAAGPGHPAPAHLGLLGLGSAGAALVAVALGAGHLRHDDGVAWGVLLVALGAVAGAYGLHRLRRRRPVTRVEAVAPGIAGAGWAVAATSGLVPTTDGVAGSAATADAALVTLLLLLAGTAAVGVRAGRRHPTVGAGEVGAGEVDALSPRASSARLAGWAGSALLVAALTASGLAATEAGHHAVDHGGHGRPAEDAGSGAGTGPSMRVPAPTGSTAPSGPAPSLPALPSEHGGH